jgi:hypothetical protein
MQNEVVAAHGDRTIKVTVALWTDSIATNPGRIVPKQAWPTGMVEVRANPSHGISSGEPIPFNTWNDLQGAVEQALENAGVTLRHGSYQGRQV